MAKVYHRTEKQFEFDGKQVLENGKPARYDFRAFGYSKQKDTYYLGLGVTCLHSWVPVKITGEMPDDPVVDLDELWKPRKEVDYPEEKGGSVSRFDPRSDW